MKFKEGDKVVVVKDSLSQRLFQYAVVEYVSVNDIYPYTLKWEIGDNDNPWMEEELELESVYNSPLYKALR